MKEIYLDHAASTEVRPEVADAMLASMVELPANPASIHLAGQRARRSLEAAREQAGHALGAGDGDSLIFTSGATEGINQALFGLASPAGSGRLFVSPLEHRAVLAVADELARRGTEVRRLQLQDGGIGPDSLAAAGLGPGDLVAAMLVNNETGALSNIRHLSNLAHDAGALLFCDATQAFGVENVDVAELHADAVVISGHKFGGPRGAGLLWLRQGLNPAPLLHGGEQERGYRAGTSNLPAIVGLALAMELACCEQAGLRERLAGLQAGFEERVTRLPGVRVIAADQPRSVKHSSCQVDGVDGEALLMALDQVGVQASVGSACAAGSLEPSHVLLAMGIDPAAARSTLRFSFGRTTTRDEALEAAARLQAAIERCRAVGPLVS